MDADRIVEMFVAFGPVNVRRMFGGIGIYADGTMFALAHEGLIYLKVDDGNRGDFEREGMSPFAYTAKNGKRAVMSYWRLPDALYDEPEDLARWAARALDAARRALSEKSAIKSKPGGARRRRA